MGFRSVLSKPFASYIIHQQNKWVKKPGFYQAKIFNRLIARARDTRFGKDHGFAEIKHYDDFRRQVPTGDYEAIRPYMELVKKGEKDVLWPGSPLYFSKTSGTTSGVKYIPITRESVSNHIDTARNALLNYIHETGNSKFVDGKLIFLSGSPELTDTAGIPTGRLSGIVNHHVPDYLRGNQMPSYATNCMEEKNVCYCCFGKEGFC